MAKDSTFASRMAFALTAGCGATLCVHPLDVTRVQMQLDAEGGAKRQFSSALGCAKHVLKADGIVRGLYAGISAGIFRQLTYGGPRMALYPILLEKFAVKGEQMSFGKKLSLGSAAGGSAALMGVPAEVCLVRMGADSKKPVAERRGYKHVFDALVRIAREEGVAALWSGAAPTVARACLLNAGQLGVYSEAKQILNTKAGLAGLPLQFCGSLISAVAAVGMSCPADVIKSRMQNAKPGQYSGLGECLSTLVKNEGVFLLFSSPHMSILWVLPFLSQLLVVV